MNSVLRKAGELGLNASAGHTGKSQDALGTKQKYGKEKDNLEILSKKVNLMSEIFARPVLRNEHLRNPHNKKIVPAKQRFGEKMHTLSTCDSMYISQTLYTNIVPSFICCLYPFVQRQTQLSCTKTQSDLCVRTPHLDRIGLLS